MGDGTAAGAGYTATVSIPLEQNFSAGVEKTDLGTLVLSGANSYTGGILSLSFAPGFVAAPGDIFKLIDAGSAISPFTLSNFGTPADGAQFAGAGSTAGYIFEYDYDGVNSLGIAGDATSLSLLVVVPEPSRAMLLLAGLLGMTARRRRRR